MEEYMAKLNKEGNSIGAKITVIASNVPVGLGEPVFDRLDADIAKALMSINAVKGVEIGAGFDSVVQKGSEHRDEITADGFSAIMLVECSVAFHQARTLLQILLSSRHPAFVYREGLSRPVARKQRWSRLGVTTLALVSGRPPSPRRCWR